MSSAAERQPIDIQALECATREALLITSIQTENGWSVLSRYGDDVWHVAGGTTNQKASQRRLNFSKLPAAFRAPMKAILYRYIHRGREIGTPRPGASALSSLLNLATPFLHHLVKLKILRLGLVTPMACAVYVDAQKNRRTQKGKLLAPGYLNRLFAAIEAIYELSQYTDDPMPMHPWPETSALTMTGRTGKGASRHQRGGTTEVIPDDVFCALFQAAWTLVERGDELLDLREKLLKSTRDGRSQAAIWRAKNAHLAHGGFEGLPGSFESTIIDLRTACYIVVASLSGCRNHELAYIQSKAYYCTEDEQGDIYWWMQSRSTKTGAGATEWMIPDAAVTALKVMDRWAAPYQALVAAEIEQRRVMDPTDPDIVEAKKHLSAVFLGMNPKVNNEVRTLSNASANINLKLFANRNGIDWGLATHQFRRTFAVYAARSQFGDLRYLKEHFKHWSLDMTLGYALNEHQELALFTEISDQLAELKQDVVAKWFESGVPLAGGFGQNLVAWRGSHDVTLFDSHKSMIKSVADSIALRSNGHSWCSAEQGISCIGNTELDKLRCTGCSHGVVGRLHANIYQGIYDHSKTLLACDDIGEAGMARVRRDITICRETLDRLGYDPEQVVA